MRIKSRCDLLESFIAQFRSLHFSLYSDGAKEVRYLILHPMPRFFRSHVVENAVIVGAAISEAFDTLEKIEITLHLLILEPISAEVIEINEAPERNDFDNLPYWKIVI